MSDGLCPGCGHDWTLHPGSHPWLLVCGTCTFDGSDCRRLAPSDYWFPVGLTLSARVSRRWRRPTQVIVEDEDGHRWACINADGTGAAAEHLLEEVREDLATLPPLPFRSKYRERISAATPAVGRREG